MDKKKRHELHQELNRIGYKQLREGTHEKGKSMSAEDRERIEEIQNLLWPWYREEYLKGLKAKG